MGQEDITKYSSIQVLKSLFSKKKSLWKVLIILTFSALQTRYRSKITIHMISLKNKYVFLSNFLTSALVCSWKSCCSLFKEIFRSKFLGPQSSKTVAKSAFIFDRPWFRGINMTLFNAAADFNFPAKLRTFGQQES